MPIATFIHVEGDLAECNSSLLSSVIVFPLMAEMAVPLCLPGIKSVTRDNLVADPPARGVQ
jgi:hypothetical protein